MQQFKKRTLLWRTVIVLLVGLLMTIAVYRIAPILNPCVGSTPVQDCVTQGQIDTDKRRKQECFDDWLAQNPEATEEEKERSFGNCAILR